MKRSLVALPLLVLLTACGTTVPLAQQQTQTVGAGLGAPGDVSAGAGSSPSVAGGVTAGPVTSGGGRQLPGQSPVFGPGAVPGAVPTGASRPAKAGAPVEVGFFVTKDLGPATKALGVDGLATGDGKRQAQAAVALVNARGGLAGHRVVPVIFEFDATSEASTQLQAACSTWFDDHKVRAVVSVYLLSTLQACAAKKGVPFVTSGNRTTSQQELQRYPLTALPPQLSLERMIPAWITSLKAQGYFTGSSKVGLVFNEDPDFSGVPSLVDRALRSVGSQLVDRQSMPGADDTSRVPAAANAGQSAALRFASQNIDRVIAVDKSGQALAHFGIAAANQNYYPVFGLTSLQLPNLLRTVLSARQLEGARGIGWSPGVDLPARSQPAVSANSTACLKAMSDAGEDMSSLGTRFSALGICEGLLVLVAAWKDPALSSGTFLPGLRALGRSFPPALTFATDFTRRVDGASAYKPLVFDADCDCFTYRGPLQTAT